MHNLRNNTHIQEALQSHKTKTQLVAVGGCGQGLIIIHIITLFVVSTYTVRMEIKPINS